MSTPSDPHGHGIEHAIDDLATRRERARQGGGADRVDAQHRAGRLTARERVERLVDAGSFVELGMLAHSDRPEAKTRSWSDGLVIGIAKVGGRAVAIEATDKTVFAGTEGHVFIRKAVALHALAVKRGLSIFNLAEGGGLRMPDGMGSDGISKALMQPEILRGLRDVPQLTAILGDSFGLPTWQAVTSDFVVQLAGTSMAVAGPRMLEVATGERISEEELGGARMHAELTGQVDVVADTEDDCIAHLKTMFAYLPANADALPPALPATDAVDRPIDELLKIVPTQRNRGYDMKRVIRVVFDRDSFYELKADFGRALVTGLARLGGRPVGVIASNPMRGGGAAGPDECDKAIDFTCLCDSYSIPLVYLHDIPGFGVSSSAEKRRMPTRIMTWAQANANVTVPRASVILRKSIGMAYGNMMGALQEADLLVAWPTAEINFTGPEVGINVVYHRHIQQAPDAAAARKELLERWEHDSSPYRAAGEYLIDDVIDPRETRKLLCAWLDAAYSNRTPKSERRLANWPMGF